MDDRIAYLHWQDNQLTCHLENRDKLIGMLIPVMRELRVQYEVQGWQYLSEPVSGAIHAADEFDLLRVGNHGWIGFTVAKPWFMTEEVIAEEFIHGVQLDLAVSLLKEIGRANYCKRLLIGTRAAPNGRHLGLCRSYEQRGMAVSTIELTLEIP